MNVPGVREPNPTADAVHSPFVLRDVARGDLPDVMRLILAHARFEGAAGAVVSTDADLERALFPDSGEPALHGLVAEVDGRVVGQALWFRTFSTWTGRPGLWLEDFYLDEQYRRLGIGRAIMAHLAAVTVANGWTRFEWAVSEDNDGGIGFYDALGSRVLADQVIRRVDGPSLSALLP